MSSSTQDPKPGGVPLPESSGRSRRPRTRDVRVGRRRQWALVVPAQLSPVKLLVLSAVVIFLALTISAPLGSYFQQRSQLQQLEIEIAQKQEKKADLQRTIEQYQDDNFLKEQARLRLGMVERGETSWRIIDPDLKEVAKDPTGTAVAKDKSKWYTKLWQSVATPPSDSGSAGPALKVPTVDDPHPNQSPGPLLPPVPTGDDAPHPEGPAPDNAPGPVPAPAQ